MTSSRSPAYDALVIGGGHNGLICAAYLARAGRKVLVLERRPVLGGAAVTEEVFPGFRFSVFSYVVSLLRPEIIRDLDLPGHGLHIVPLESTFNPLPNGDYLATWADPEETRHELYRHSPRDADAYQEFGRLMQRMAMAVKPLLGMAPPDPASWRPGDLVAMGRLAKHFRDLGETEIHALVKLMTMSSADYLGEWFESEALKAAKSASGIIGTFLGPRSPGTAYVLLHHYMGEIDGAFRAWGIPRGGTGGISEAIASAARAAGVQIRTEAPVARIDVRNGRAEGVVLESGEEIAAGTVLSSVDSHVTFLRLVEPSNLEPSFLEEVKRYKFRGSSGKVNLALDALPELACRPGKGEWLRGAISFSPGVDYMERAYDDAKYGRFSQRPYIDCIIPTLVDPSMAPPGKHVMSCFVQYAPYHLSEARVWDDAERDAFGETVIATLEERFPKIRDLILHQQVLTPLDIERITGLTEGNIFQGELSLEQLFFNRPVAGWARYRTPLR
ncbi:MAG: phytoene desaturase family protein, partial [Gemmatimonadota bacterium]